MRSIAAAACRRVSLALLTATVCIMTVVWTLFIKLSARLWQSSLLTSLSTFLKGSFAISEGRRCIFQSRRNANSIVFFKMAAGNRVWPSGLGCVGFSTRSKDFFYLWSGWPGASLSLKPETGAEMIACVGGVWVRGKTSCRKKKALWKKQQAHKLESFLNLPKPGSQWTSWINI